MHGERGVGTDVGGKLQADGRFRKVERFRIRIQSLIPL